MDEERPDNPLPPEFAGKLILPKKFVIPSEAEGSASPRDNHPRHEKPPRTMQSEEAS